MAAISSYSSQSPVIAGDKWIGTSANDSSTKNFTADSVREYINPHNVYSSSLTTYTLLLRDAYNTIIFTGAGNADWTIPTNASVAYETGTLILVANQTAFTVTIAGAVGVSTFSANLVIAAGDAKWLKKTDTDTWSIF